MFTVNRIELFRTYKFFILCVSLCYYRFHISFIIWNRWSNWKDWLLAANIFFCRVFFSFGMCPLNVNQSKGFFLTMTFILHINFFVHPRMWMHIFPISFEVWINHKSFILFYTFFALWVYTFRQFHFVSSVFELLEYQEKSEIKQTHFSEFFNQYHIQASVINSRKLLYVYDKAH